MKWIDGLDENDFKCLSNNIKFGEADAIINMMKDKLLRKDKDVLREYVKKAHMLIGRFKRYLRIYPVITTRDYRWLRARSNKEYLKLIDEMKQQDVSFKNRLAIKNIIRSSMSSINYARNVYDMLKDAGYNPCFQEIYDYLNGLPNPEFDKICTSSKRLTKSSYARVF
jgi:hypothetical protein